ncbi:MAG: hypothetical protein C0485_19285 [Pirellula sp.]|nr:hypothetical protein [Pirellula sp.]
MDLLLEACDLARGKHYVAAASLAHIGVGHAMSDLAVAYRPDLKRFFAGKRLASFLRCEGVIDGKLSADLAAFASRAYQLKNTPTGKRSDVHTLIATAAKLRRRMRAIQRSL